MSDILNSMNSSPVTRGVPRQGASVSIATPDADIAALLEQITSADPDGFSDMDTANYDGPDDPDLVDDLDKIVESLPAEISAPSVEPTKPSSPVTPSIDLGVSDDDDDLIDSDDETEDSSDGSPVDIKKYLIAGVTLVAVIILAVILSNTFGKPKEKFPEQQTSQSVGTSQSTFYADQLNTTDANTYQDSMVIEKYIILDQDACIFVFRGYAENARAFVTAYVDIDTYNRYKTGARVPILYERISISGEDYYMKVRVNA